MASLSTPDVGSDNPTPDEQLTASETANRPVIVSSSVDGDKSATELTEADNKPEQSSPRFANPVPALAEGNIASQSQTTPTVGTVALNDEPGYAYNYEFSYGPGSNVYYPNGSRPHVREQQLGAAVTEEQLASVRSGITLEQYQVGPLHQPSHYSGYGLDTHQSPYRRLERYAVQVANVPPAYSWRNLRDLIRSVMPQARIVYTKVETPGVGCVFFREYDSALECVHHLDGLHLQSGHALSATILDAAPIETGTAPIEGETQVPVVNSVTSGPGSPLPMQVASPVFSPVMSHSMPQMMNPAGQPQAQFLGTSHMPYLASHPTHTAPPLGYAVISPPAQRAVLAPQAEMWPMGSATVGGPYVAHQGYMQRSHNQPQQMIAGYQQFPSTAFSRMHGGVSERQRVFIGNIPFTTQWQDLKDFLRDRIGHVYRVEIPTYEDNRPKGFAIATFYTEEDAANAIKIFDGAKFKGREINVRYDRVRRFNQAPFVGAHATTQFAPLPSNEEYADGQRSNEMATPD